MYANWFEAPPYFAFSRLDELPRKFWESGKAKGRRRITMPLICPVLTVNRC